MKLYFIAGEASGDLHGKNLLAALRQARPGLQFRGVGGDGMAAQGMELRRHIRDTSFMGFVEVVQNLGAIRRLFADIKSDIKDWKPDAVVLIDYPGFNLRMAKFVHQLGIPVLYYISPQVWAWKKGRVKQVRRYVDRMFVILPFEQEFYAKEGIEVEYHGHPLLDEIARRDWDVPALRQELVPNAGDKRILALLPGSRMQEIRRMLPVMWEAARQIEGLPVVVAGAPGRQVEEYRQIGLPESVPVHIGRTYDILAIADAALVTSGTATLETALFHVPQAVCYAGSGLSVWLARRLIQVKYISLVNLVMDREVIREIIQKEMNAEELREEIELLIASDADRSSILTAYSELEEKLGEAGASRRTAVAMLSFLDSKG